MVPGAVDILGAATNPATVTVNGILAYRHGTNYEATVPVNNAGSAVWQSVTNVAVLGGSTNTDATATGSLFLPQNPESFSYDLDGNLTQDGRFNYTWDAENRLTAMTNTASIAAAGKYALTFAYDYMGRRIQKIVYTNSSGTWVPSYTNKFLYDGWNVVAVLDGGNNLLYSFVWGSDLSGSMQGAGGVGGLVSMTVHNGANAGTYSYAYDGNGNVMALVNAATGVIAAQYEYGPFGELLRATGPMAFTNPFRFSTKYQDDETGLLYYGYRYYNAGTGRWPSRDPIGEAGGLNLHSFVGNSSINSVDALGLRVIDHKFVVVEGGSIFNPFNGQWAGVIGHWGQPATHLDGSKTVGHDSASSTVTASNWSILFGWVGSGGACNSLGDPVNGNINAGTIQLYIVSDCPGTVTVTIQASYDLSCFGGLGHAAAGAQEQIMATAANGSPILDNSIAVLQPGQVGRIIISPVKSYTFQASVKKGWTLVASAQPVVKVAGGYKVATVSSASQQMSFISAQ
jgi:RHS repeat-associated protein